MTDEKVYPHRRQYTLRRIGIEEIQGVMDSGGEHALTEIADDLRDVEDYQGLQCTVSHLDA